MTLKLDTVEQVLAYLYTNKSINRVLTAWDKKFVESNYNNFQFSGKSLTTKQAVVALSIINRCVSYFPTAEQLAVRNLIASPAYSRPLIESKEIAREVRHLFDSFVVFRFPWRSAQVEEIRRIGSTSFFKALYLNESFTKVWIVHINSENYESISNFIKDNDFDFDDETLKLIFEINSSLNKHSSASIQDDKIVLEIRDNNFSSMVLSEMKWMFPDV